MFLKLPIYLSSAVLTLKSKSYQAEAKCKKQHYVGRYMREQIASPPDGGCQAEKRFVRKDAHREPLLPTLTGSCVYGLVFLMFYCFDLQFQIKLSLYFSASLSKIQALIIQLK